MTGSSLEPRPPPLLLVTAVLTVFTPFKGETWHSTVLGWHSSVVWMLSLHAGFETFSADLLGHKLSLLAPRGTAVCNELL